MTSDRAAELNGRMNEADATFRDSDDVNRQGATESATPMIKVIVNQNRWYYYHVSTP